MSWLGRSYFHCSSALYSDHSTYVLQSTYFPYFLSHIHCACYLLIRPQRPIGQERVVEKGRCLLKPRTNIPSLQKVDCR